MVASGFLRDSVPDYAVRPLICVQLNVCKLCSKMPMNAWMLGWEASSLSWDPGENLEGETLGNSRPQEVMGAATKETSKLAFLPIPILLYESLSGEFLTVRHLPHGAVPQMKGTCR